MLQWHRIWTYLWRLKRLTMRVIADAILIGDAALIKPLSEKAELPENICIIDEPDADKAALKAVSVRKARPAYWQRAYKYQQFRVPPLRVRAAFGKYSAILQPMKFGREETPVQSDGRGEYC